MKIAIIGSRDFSDYNLMVKVLDEEAIDYIISGGAKGADKMSIKYAQENIIPYIEYKAKWNDLSHPNAVIKTNRYGQYDALAGFRRNTKIIEECDKVIAFWDGISKGTLDSLKKAKSLNKKIKIVKYLLIQNQNEKTFKKDN